MPIAYNKLKAGDTLIVTGKPHYGPDNKPFANAGEEVLVEAVHPEGVTVKTKGGKTASLYFEHGAEKLKYTKDTEDAIKKRAAFGKTEEKTAFGKTEEKTAFGKTEEKTAFGKTEEKAPEGDKDKKPSDEKK